MRVKPTDLNQAIAAIAADEIATALAPYRKMLDGLTALIGPAPAPRVSAERERKAEMRRLKRRFVRATAGLEDTLPAPAAGPRPDAGREAVKPAEAPPASAPVNFAIGQTVIYRQGAGAFEAKVVDLAADGVLMLERVKDGAKVKRPATKVIAAP